MLYPSIVSLLELLVIVYITQFDKIITESDTQHMSEQHIYIPSNPHDLTFHTCVDKQCYECAPQTFHGVSAPVKLDP